ncbi:MAG: Uma2 family endonuclease [Acidobacteriaceae bacterium]|nr:Uma2 family endonuclease [Acidobacteriaceae bacterium]
MREDHWRRPDVAVIRAEDAEPWKYIIPGHWPVLCVELVSPPSPSVEQLLEKCKLYHQQGVAYCWVIEPESRMAWTFHRSAQPVQVTESGSLDADSANVSINLTDLWRGLKNKRSNRNE